MAKKNNKKKNNKKKIIRSSDNKNAFAQIWESPCLYCDSKPVYLGTAVFLKDDRTIMYDPKLRRLISTRS